MSYTRGLALPFGGALFGSLAGALSLWTHKQTKDVPFDKKGNILGRINEMASVLRIASLSSNPLSHIRTIASLPSKISMTETKKGKRIYHKDNWAQYTEGLKWELEKTYSDGNPLVFMVKSVNSWKRSAGSQGPLYHNRAPFNRFNKFCLIGSISNFDSLKVREDIINGNYVRCPSAIWIKKHASASYDQVDAIVAGTNKASTCNEIVKDIIYGTALRAAKVDSSKPNLDRFDPNAKTPVIVNEKSQGNLLELSCPEGVLIREGKFRVKNIATSPYIELMAPMPTKT